MKKSTRSFLLAILFTASLGSYWFLSHAPNATTTSNTTIEVVETSEENNQATFVMPDVGIIKEVIELTKAFVPSR